MVVGEFVRRQNRFAALVRVDGREEHVHVRNSGRLRELLTPGRPVLLEPAERARRATAARKAHFARLALKSAQARSKSSGPTSEVPAATQPTKGGGA